MQKQAKSAFSFLLDNRMAAALFFLFVGLVIYAPSLNNHFLLDDESQIVDNELIHSLHNIDAFFLGSTMHQMSNSLGGLYYKPVMSLSYSVLWWLSPGNPFPFHLFQLLVVIANAFLVFVLLRRHMSALAAWLMALLLLVHPINTEVVTYMADLQDALYTFFGLLALNFIASRTKFDWGSFAALVLLLLGSFLSKESGVLYFIIGIVYSLVFRRDIWKRVASASVVSAVVYLFLRLGVAHLTQLIYKQNQIGRADLSTRLMTAPMVLGSYLWKFIFPRDLTATQDWVIQQLSVENFWLPLAAALAVLVISIWYSVRDSRKVPHSLTFAFFTYWIFMGMGFHSHIFVPLDGTVADRWFYFSSIGLLAMIGLFLDRAALPRAPRMTVAVGLILAAALGARSYLRSLDWYDNYTLCLHDLQISPDSYDMHNNLGVEFFRRGQVNEAKNEFERSVKLAPNWDINWNNLGAAYGRLGNIKMAESSYLKSMEHGTYYMAYENYATILVAQGRIAEAKKFISETALPLFPASKSLHIIYNEIQNK